MTETAKERIYRKAFEEIKIVCDTQDHVDNDLLRFFITKKMMEIENMPSTTDKLSVEKLQEIRVEELKNFNSKILQAELKNQKLQEQLNTAKKALIEICEFDCSDDCYSTAYEALMEIDEGFQKNISKVNEFIEEQKKIIEGSGDGQ